jgi:FkbM family methyltransferase
MLGAYKRYPFKIPIRVKFFNTFRYFFTLAPFEKLLTNHLSHHPLSWCKKLIPPLYFYNPGSRRTVMRDGVHYSLDISRLLDHSIYFNNVNDAAWTNLFRMLRTDFNIIDAGANIGYLSLYFAKRCQKGLIYSFEPDSENFQDLSRNIQLNSFKNIRLYNKALGDKPTMARLYKIYASNPGANRILPDALKKDLPSEVVEVTTLDGLDEQGCFKKIDLIKIDVEGFEGFVLRGGQRLITRWKPILFVELVDENLQLHHYSSLSLVEYIESVGYDIWDAKAMKRIDKSNLRYTDILCFPKEIQ